MKSRGNIEQGRVELLISVESIISLKIRKKLFITCVEGTIKALNGQIRGNVEFRAWLARY